MAMDCGDCLYYDSGSCYRNAPVPGASTRPIAVWPIVAPEQWCGDWRPGSEDWRSATEPPHMMVLRDLLEALEASTGIPVSSIL